MNQDRIRSCKFNKHPIMGSKHKGAVRMHVIYSVMTAFVLVFYSGMVYHRGETDVQAPNIPGHISMRSSEGWVGNFLVHRTPARWRQRDVGCSDTHRNMTTRLSCITTSVYARNFKIDDDVNITQHVQSSNVNGMSGVTDSEHPCMHIKDNLYRNPSTIPASSCVQIGEASLINILVCHMVAVWRHYITGCADTSRREDCLKFHVIATTYLCKYKIFNMSHGYVHNLILTRNTSQDITCLEYSFTTNMRINPYRAKGNNDGRFLRRNPTFLYVEPCMMSNMMIFIFKMNSVCDTNHGLMRSIGHSWQCQDVRRIQNRLITEIAHNRPNYERGQNGYTRRAMPIIQEKSTLRTSRHVSSCDVIIYDNEIMKRGPNKLHVSETPDKDCHRLFMCYSFYANKLPLVLISVDHEQFCFSLYVQLYSSVYVYPYLRQIINGRITGIMTYESNGPSAYNYCMVNNPFTVRSIGTKTTTIQT